MRTEIVRQRILGRPWVAALLFIFLTTSESACRRVDRGTPEAVRQAIEEVRLQVCPDRRLAVFDIEVERRGFNLKLVGEVTSAAGKDRLVALVKEVAPNYKVEEEIRVLPDPALGARKYGIVRVSVANLRAEPRHGSELVNQVLMGSVVRLLKQEGSWFYGQAEDGYLGWITGGSMVRSTEDQVQAWEESARVVVTVPTAVVRRQPAADAIPVSDAVLLDEFRYVGEKGRWVEVETPDGRRGFLRRTEVAQVSDFVAGRPSTPEAIVRTAMRLLGRPYLWGGTSTKGFDCSGLTQTVFRFNGIQLLRDASQQARMGERVEPGSEFENLRPGDLLFFGPKAGRITHVGIYIGNQRFIHAGAENSAVRINSFDRADSLYSEGRSKTFLEARRVVGVDVGKKAGSD